MGSYKQWTAALGDYFFPREQSGKVVALAVDPELLRQIAQEHMLFAFSPTDEEAVAGFAEAVAQDILSFGWISEPPTLGVYPSALARCSLFALAYSLTHRKASEIGRPAFWREVWTLLLCSSEVAAESGGIPTGLPGPDPFRLTGALFQQLWRAGLAAWINDIEGGRWGRMELPEERSGPSCHVHLVQSQAGLRQLDLDRSGALFKAAGLQPSQVLTDSELWARVQPHFDRTDLLLPPARDVVADPSRQGLARMQLAAAFSTWHGEDVADRSGHLFERRPRIWLQIDNGCLHGGLVMWRLDGNDHLDERPLDEVLVPSSAGLGTGYQHRGDCLITVFDTFDQLYVEERRATPGDRILFLVPLALVTEAKAWCEEVGEEVSDPMEIVGVPAGWVVFSLRVKKFLQPKAYEGRFGELLADNAGVRLIGGLRLGGRNRWMAGAGPALEVLDVRNRAAIEIDGEQVEHGDDMVAMIEAPMLNEVGRHTITVNGREVKSLVVVEPTRATVAATSAWILLHASSWPTSQSQNYSSEASLTIDGPCVRLPESAADAGVADPSTRAWLVEAAALARREPAHYSARRENHALVRQLREARRSRQRSLS